MQYSQAWFQCFTAALTGAAQALEMDSKQLCTWARSVADEAMQHLTPGVIDDLPGKPGTLGQQMTTDPADPIPPVDDDHAWQFLDERRKANKISATE